MSYLPQKQQDADWYDNIIGLYSKDPLFDLIIQDELKQNKYPKSVADYHKNPGAFGHVPLCVKYCTPEVWEKYKNKKSTGKAKWTMKRTINSGVMYPESFVGCHVGDMESYDDFKEFWYPVIEDYHTGFKVNSPKRAQISTAERFDVNRLPQISEAASKRIVSTRIRCARNFAMFPLNPGAKNVATRNEILNMMDKVYASFPTDFSGTLYKHETMSDQQRQALVDAHFLFRGKDKMQAASGYHQYWPKGRGIFVRDDKKFLNWLNEGDHLRIISMEYGSDVTAVFERLGRGVVLVEEKVRKQRNIPADEDVFMVHPKLGVISCCPSNLGSGLRASVFLKIPELLSVLSFEKIDEMCRNIYHCQIRGVGGEHSAPGEDGRVDVSNWRRIGFFEYELVTDMITCCNALTELEEKIISMDAERKARCKAANKIID